MQSRTNYFNLFLQLNLSFSDHILKQTKHQTNQVETGFKIAVRVGLLPHYRYELYIVCNRVQINHLII